MSYQNGELVAPYRSNSKEDENSSSFWKIIIVASALIVTGLMSYSVSEVNSIQKPLISNIQLAKSGEYNYSALSKSEKKELFDEFKTEFGRQYADDDEEDEGFDNFEEFLVTVDERNSAEEAAGGTGQHGITKFADLSDADFRKHYLGFQVDDLDEALKSGKNGDSIASASMSSSASQTSRNWEGTYTTPVKDQGYCGSCWAFSAASQLESDSIKAGYLNTTDNLSEQQIISCDTYDNGCYGGITVYAYLYIYKAGGVTFNQTYPYTSYYDDSGSCKSNTNDFKITVTDFYYLTTESAMQNHVLYYGPLSVCLDAQTWASYTHGVLSTCGTTVDHCVQIVGVNTEEEYWIVRNSWGTDWGMNGYIKLKTNVNICDITYVPTFTQVAIVGGDDDV